MKKLGQQSIEKWRQTEYTRAERQTGDKILNILLQRAIFLIFHVREECCMYFLHARYAK
jgi:hypothetical protein